MQHPPAARTAPAGEGGRTLTSWSMSSASDSEPWSVRRSTACPRISAGRCATSPSPWITTTTVGLAWALSRGPLDQPHDALCRCAARPDHHLSLDRLRRPPHRRRDCRAGAPNRLLAHKGRSRASRIGLGSVRAAAGLVAAVHRRRRRGGIGDLLAPGRTSHHRGAERLTWCPAVGVARAQLGSRSRGAATRNFIPAPRWAAPTSQEDWGGVGVEQVRSEPVAVDAAAIRTASSSVRASSCDSSATRSLRLHPRDHAPDVCSPQPSFPPTQLPLIARRLLAADLHTS